MSDDREKWLASDECSKSVTEAFTKAIKKVITNREQHGVPYEEVREGVRVYQGPNDDSYDFYFEPHQEEYSEERYQAWQFIHGLFDAWKWGYTATQLKAEDILSLLKGDAMGFEVNHEYSHYMKLNNEEIEKVKKALGV